MSDLPKIDSEVIARKLVEKIRERDNTILSKDYQLVQIETLAEALRAERDEARLEIEELKNRINEPVQVVTTLTAEA